MNYLDASVEEVVEHVLTVTSQSVSQMLTYHKNKGHTQIVDKIIEARKRAAKIRLLKNWRVTMIEWDKWFYYDETSKSGLRWKVQRRAGKDYQIVMVDVGDECGYQDSFGHWQVDLEGKAYLCHKIIWQMFNGEIPDGLFIDHFNRVAGDNKIGNLRLVDRQGNCRNRTKGKNNKSGVTGVVKCVQYGCHYWMAFWNNLEGKRKCKTFSFIKYGSEKAFEMAVKCRSEAIQDLNSQGAGYTLEHGT